MNLQEFYYDTVCVTMKDLNNELLNKTHMVTGMTSEIFDELSVAIATKDAVNFREEIGDTEWFLLGYMKYYDLFIPEETPDKKKFVFNYLNTIYGQDMAPEEETDLAMMATIYMNHVLGVFNAILKKEITSGVMKYEGEEVSNEFLQDRCEGLLWSLMILACTEFGDFHVDTLVMPGPIRGIRVKIHEKLVLRHKGGAMTTESDLGRDKDAERQGLES